jgi:hypothetical protein
MTGPSATRLVRREPELPVRVVEADLCVVGAGAAGMSAALEAAALGARVALVDGAAQLGGQSVGSLIGTFCGLYSNGPAPVQVTHGMADGIIADLSRSGDLENLPSRRNTRILRYRANGLVRWYERRAAAAGLKLLLGATIVQVARAARRIVHVDVATRYGAYRVCARGFVDASGDAALAFEAGAECRVPDRPVYGTSMFTLSGVDPAFVELKAIESALAARGADWGLRRRDGFAFASEASGETLVNMTHIDTPLEALAAADAMLDGRDQVDRLVGFLKAEFPRAFARARVDVYGLPGIRQTRWIAGARQLCVEDVRAGTRFSDAVARCSWPIELHDRPDVVTWEQFGDDHMHYVPFGAQVSPALDNMVAAGRCVDGDAAALSSIRVMGPCIAMGAAAAHALDLAGAGSVHQIDVAALQARLAANLD